MSPESGFRPGKHDGIVVTCPYALNPAALCSSVSSKIKDKDQSGPYQYLYQRQVYEAACVNLDVDGDDVIANKVGDFWDANAERLVCDSTQFNVPNGSILKFAVEGLQRLHR